MHPEIEREKSGKCPKCGMKLVEKAAGDRGQASVKLQKYFSKLGPGYRPLIIIIGTIFLLSLANTFFHQPYSIKIFISTFMTWFFLIFAFFKLADLKGFADGYSTYDLLAKQWYGYGFLYPFIELFFGLAMIFVPLETIILKAEIVVMTFSGIGVLIKILKHQKFQCSCLGTFLKVPLTKVTLIEDFGMAILAVLLLIL